MPTGDLLNTLDIYRAIDEEIVRVLGYPAKSQLARTSQASYKNGLISAKYLICSLAETARGKNTWAWVCPGCSATNLLPERECWQCKWERK